MDGRAVEDEKTPAAQLRPAAPPAGAADTLEMTTAEAEAAAAERPEMTTADTREMAAVAASPTATPARTRRLAPVRLAGAGARAVADWCHRPAGRLVLSGLLLLVLVSVSGAAGRLLVPAASSPLPQVTASGDPDAPVDGPTAPDQSTATFGPTTPAITVPTGAPTGAVYGRPSDVLANWARQTGTRVGVPAVAMQAYGYAQLVLARTDPACRLSWTTLAAIGKIESGHGRANHATLGQDGKALPRIVGLPLDGKDGRQRVADTDAGAIDGDPNLDRAVGPMQFIPSTWKQYGVDADNDSQKDPNDIDDAALAAGKYLCAGGRDLSTGKDWWAAILSYNAVRPYAQKVFDAANEYGIRSRT